MNILINLCLYISTIVQIYGAQPRSTSFRILDIPKAETLGQFSKLLRPPLAFSYNQDSKSYESVINQRRLKPDPPPTIRRLDSKRILMPKKYVKDVPAQGIPEKEEFLIYVPEEEQHSQSQQITVPDQSKEESKEELREPLQEAEFAETSSEVKNAPESDQHIQETHRKKHTPKPVNTKYSKGSEKSDKSDYHETHKKKSDRGYEAEHVKHKVEMGHHIEKGKSGHHEDKGGDEKKFDKGEDYEAAHHEEDDGKKGSKYEEDGENDKGHATKGTHNIRKKDEYVKKIEFFDEYHEDSDEDEDGAHEDDKDYKKGHHDQKEHRDSAYQHNDYDDYTSLEDTDEHKYSEGKHDADSHAQHHDHGNEHGKKSNHETKKIWKIIVTGKNR